MPYKSYDIQDTHITDYYPTSSVSMDEVLYLGISGSQSNNNEYRVLTTFDVNSVITQVVSASATASLYFELLDVYPRYNDIEITARLLSGSYEHGIGKVKLPVTSSVSWKNRNSTEQWLTGSYATNVTASFYNNIEGGGNYYTTVSSSYTLPYNYNLDYIDIPITDLITYVDTEGIPFDGIIITATSDLLRLYSNETHTIYKPKVITKYIDNTTLGINDFIETLRNLKVTISNLNESYRQDQRYRFVVNANNKSNVKQFKRNRLFTRQVNYLPTSSYYSVLSVDTNRTIIPFSEHTKINSNEIEGNYFDFWFSILTAYQKYRFVIKVVNDSEEYYFESPIFTVKPNT